MLNTAQYLLDRLFLRIKSPDLQRQVGALPYAIINDRVAFLIITSRRSGRWIYPKGSTIEGQRPWETAAQEAHEEAGVSGNIAETPIGSYRTIKTGSIRRHVAEVDLYPLCVTNQFEEWPEKEARHRHWVLLTEAKRLLSDPILVELTVKLSRNLVATGQPASAFIRK